MYRPIKRFKRGLRAVDLLITRDLWLVVYNIEEQCSWSDSIGESENLLRICRRQAAIHLRLLFPQEASLSIELMFAVFRVAFARSPQTQYFGLDITPLDHLHI